MPGWVRKDRRDSNRRPPSSKPSRRIQPTRCLRDQDSESSTSPSAVCELILFAKLDAHEAFDQAGVMVLVVSNDAVRLCL